MKTQEKTIPGGEVILYKSEDGSLAIDVKLEEETVWLTQVQMAELFDKAKPTILEYIKNAYDEHKLDRESTCRKFRQVQIKGKRKITRQIDYYYPLCHNLFWLPREIQNRH